MTETFVGITCQKLLLGLRVNKFCGRYATEKNCGRYVTENFVGVTCQTFVGTENFVRKRDENHFRWRSPWGGEKRARGTATAPKRPDGRTTVCRP